MSTTKRFFRDTGRITGGLMIVGGIIGALFIPILSDRYKRRTPFIVIAPTGATLGLTGITFATSYWLLLTSGMILGFFLLSSGPIGFQYGAEITYPASEGTSNGILLFMGQVCGYSIHQVWTVFKSAVTGSITRSLVLMIGLMVLSILMSFKLKESTILSKTNDQ